jgi:hypothetical protein
VFLCVNKTFKSQKVERSSEEFLYAGCRYAKRRYDECHSADCRFRGKAHYSCHARGQCYKQFTLKLRT